jgi:hypothetical protein
LRVCSFEFPRKRNGLAAAVPQRDDAGATCNELQSVDDLHLIPENTNADESVAKKPAKHAVKAMREKAIFSLTPPNYVTCKKKKRSIVGGLDMSARN